MEIWDAYKNDGTLAGFDLVRDQPIPKGFYHLVCEVLVKHKDGSYLLMKRSYQKANYPGFYETSAGGSALKGENKLSCVKRELKEETGIDSNSFIELGKTVNEKSKSIYYSFLCITNCDKKSILLQKGETIDYKWVSKDEFIEFLNSDKVIKSQIKRISNYLEILNIGKQYHVKIDRKLGTSHPDHKDIVYPINYGYIPEIIGGDNEEQDAYIIGVNQPINEFDGILIGVIIRRDDNETKWIIAPSDNFDDEEIMKEVEFQEKYFDSILLR